MPTVATRGGASLARSALIPVLLMLAGAAGADLLVGWLRPPIVRRGLVEMEATSGTPDIQLAATPRAIAARDAPLSQPPGALPVEPEWLAVLNSVPPEPVGSLGPPVAASQSRIVVNYVPPSALDEKARETLRRGLRSSLRHFADAGRVRQRLGLDPWRSARFQYVGTVQGDGFVASVTGNDYSVPATPVESAVMYAGPELHLANPALIGQLASVLDAHFKSGRQIETKIIARIVSLTETGRFARTASAFAICNRRLFIWPPGHDPRVDEVVPMHRDAWDVFTTGLQALRR